MAKDERIVDFKGGPSWCLRFMRRKDLSIRNRTTLCQSLPKDSEEKLAAFQAFCKEKMTTNNIEPDYVINMEEVPLTFDLPLNRAVECKGSSTVSIRTTGHEKSSFIVVLAVSVSCIVNGFRKAEIIASSEEATMSDDEDDFATVAKMLPSSIAELFNSETEDEEFEGFSDRE